MSGTMVLHVFEDARGEWRVCADTSSGEVLGVFATRSEAEKAARKVIARSGGGQVCVDVKDNRGVPPPDDAAS
jgi:hypothetical protein